MFTTYCFNCALLVSMSPDFSSARSAQKLSSGSPDKSLCPALEPYRDESSAGGSPPHLEGTHGQRRAAAGGAAPAGCWSERNAAGRRHSERWRQWFTSMKYPIFSFTILQNNKCSSCLNPEYKPGPVSVMELLRPKDRERILNIRGPSTQPSQNASTQAVSPAVGGSVSSGLQQEALAAWKGTQTSSETFRPFEKNSSKQARYDMYLSRLKQGDKGKTVRVTGSRFLTVFLALLTMKQTAGVHRPVFSGRNLLHIHSWEPSCLFLIFIQLSCSNHF